MLVLEPRDLLHRVIAAGGDLEGRERLAEEHARRLDQLGAARRVVLLAQGVLRGGVMRLGEVEHAQLGAHGLASERVRRPQLVLVAMRQPRVERLVVAGAQLERGRAGGRRGLCH